MLKLEDNHQLYFSIIFCGAAHKSLECVTSPNTIYFHAGIVKLLQKIEVCQCSFISFSTSTENIASKHKIILPIYKQRQIIKQEVIKILHQSTTAS